MAKKKSFHKIKIIFIIGCLLIISIVEGCNSKDDTEKTMNTSPQQAIELIDKYKGVNLPDDVVDAECFMESLMVMFVYVKFDIPQKQLSIILQKNKRLPSINDFAIRDNIVKDMIVTGNQLSWWKLNEFKGDKLCALSTGNKTIDGSNWKWSFNLCILKLDGNMRRVYLLYSEEPAAP